MAYQVVTDKGVALDAHFSVEPSAVIIHSRGGGSSPVNTEYGPGLRQILSKLKRSKLKLTGAWVDSSRVQKISLAKRSLLNTAELSLPADQIFHLMTVRMMQVGQEPGASGGNPTRRLRLGIGDAPFNAAIVAALGGRSVPRTFSSLDRLPHEMLRQVTDENIWWAVEYLRNGGTHIFHESIDYDVILDDGSKLPPKAVFGVAATEALGFQVKPRHFYAGMRTPAFQAIAHAGYEIVRKGEKPKAPPNRPDAEWREGNPALRNHLRKERAPGLSNAKKAEFVRTHGRLFCERCKLDPVKEFKGKHGEAAIEVHHAMTHVADMKKGHITKLSDLQCLCANCHRVEHRIINLMKSGKS